MSTTLYQERYRPQVHFTARSGWLNDPNGLVYHAGEYHLFFQHNPQGTEWGNMTWGHAVSEDLVHWRQLPHALLPYDGGTIFSGSAVVDGLNSAGFQEGVEPPLVAAFTHARRPFGQALAYSRDRGRSWTLYDHGQHVVPNQGRHEEERDPRIFWHAASGRWVMVLWVAPDTARILTSEDLIHWVHASDFVAPGFYECPDLFELPVEGQEGQSRWVLHDAAFTTWIGAFDGQRFCTESGPLQGDYGRCFYAAQTWNNLPGRRVQIAWMRGGAYPHMPFNQQMSFPCVLTLCDMPEGLRVRRTPVAELACLRGERLFHDSLTLRPGVNPLAGIRGDTFEIRLVAEAGPWDAVGITVHGREVVYAPASGVLSAAGSTAPLRPQEGMVELHLLVDRTSVEAFGNGGMVSISSCFVPESEVTGLRACAQGAPVVIRELCVYRLGSIWVPSAEEAGTRRGEM